ncbi:hypothetical protein [Streptomyces sp. NPDC059010]|uniref:Rv1733c family protein n=1 Tax=Streptomyces sp. NPDC059010 TaxID=3346695 RepID=UPI0036A6843A
MVRSRRVRMWRWRRNPLRRRSDLIEAWVVLTGWALVFVGSILAGLTSAGAFERDAERKRAESRRVPAVLVEDAQDRVSMRGTSDYRVWATVRWTATDGSTHTDEARVPVRARAGSTVTVWTDGNGRITVDPLTEGEARLHAVFGGVMVGTGAGGVVWGAVWVVRRGLERRRMAQWDTEWERIGTRWGWKAG